MGCARRFACGRRPLARARALRWRRLGGRWRAAGIEAYRTLMDVNAFGTLFALRTGAELMRENGGSIVTIASVTAARALDSPDLNVGYGASKSAVRMLTHAFAKQEGRNGIRANCILPGFMTPMRGSRMPLRPRRIAIPAADPARPDRHRG